MDGTLLALIASMKGSKGNYADPNEYSTSENKIGKWTDEAPVYQKVIYTSSLSNSNNILKGTVDNLKDIIDFRIFALRQVTVDNKTVKVPVSQNDIVNIDLETPGVNKLNYWCRTGLMSDNVGVYIDSNDTNKYYNVKIIIQYTKTID